jgi:hypothetical protein
VCSLYVLPRWGHRVNGRRRSREEGRPANHSNPTHELPVTCQGNARGSHSSAKRKGDRLSIVPSLKYESDGGPGIPTIMEFLKASDTPFADQRTFFKAQIVFWLIGATDGHAKNFSVRLAPGGRFRLTPLYDIISTQPSFDAGQITRNQMKLAMAVGTNRHYAVHTIVGRHFLQTARGCGLPDRTIQEVIAEITDTTEKNTDQALAAMEDMVPDEIASSIINGLRTFFSVMEIQAKRLGSWQAAMAYPRPIMVLGDNTKKPTVPNENSGNRSEALRSRTLSRTS